MSDDEKAVKTIRFAYVPVGARFYVGTLGSLVFKKVSEDKATYGGSTVTIDLEHPCRLAEVEPNDDPLGIKAAMRITRGHLELSKPKAQGVEVENND